MRLKGRLNQCMYKGNSGQLDELAINLSVFHECWLGMRLLCPTFLRVQPLLLETSEKVKPRRQVAITTWGRRAVIQADYDSPHHRRVLDLPLQS